MMVASVIAAVEEMGKPFKDFRAELERQHLDLRGRSAAEISAKSNVRRAKARDRGSRRGPNQVTTRPRMTIERVAGLIGRRDYCPAGRAAYDAASPEYLA
jgi:hypothetical protein